MDKGSWQAKMLVRDLVASKSQVINLDILAVRPNWLRIEVVASLGTHIATFVMNPAEVRYALTQQKRFIIGPTNEKSLNSVVGVALDPKLLMNLLFDEAPAGTGWDCKKDKKQFLESCFNKARGVTLSWKDREVSRRRVTIDAKNFSIQLALQGFSTKVEGDSSRFDLKAPEGFKTERIN